MQTRAREAVLVNIRAHSGAIGRRRRTIQRQRPAVPRIPNVGAGRPDPVYRPARPQHRDVALRASEETRTAGEVVVIGHVQHNFGKPVAQQGSSSGSDSKIIRWTFNLREPIHNPKHAAWIAEI